MKTWEQFETLLIHCRIFDVNKITNLINCTHQELQFWKQQNKVPEDKYRIIEVMASSIGCRCCCE